jgi:hypothetical protein
MVYPSSLSLGRGGAVAFTATVVRKEGFDGDVDLVLKNAPDGFKLSGARVPRGKDTAQVALIAPRDLPPQVFPLQLEAQAKLGAVTVSHPVTPTEYMMQAFAYWHFVPQQELLVAVTGSRPVPAIWRPLAQGLQPELTTPVQIPQGGTAQVQIKATQSALAATLNNTQFELVEPPRGVRLQSTTVTPTGVTLTLKADENIAQVGDATNLIVAVSTDAETKAQAGSAAARKGRVSLGVLPPIAFQIGRP